MRGLYLGISFVLALRVSAAPPVAAGVSFTDRFIATPNRHGPMMVYIAANSFLMGSSPEEFGYTPYELRHPVQLSAFSIGKYEVTNAEFCRFLNNQGNQIDGGIPWILTGRSHRCRIQQHGAVFTPVPGFANHPVVTVSWLGARAYCRWLSQQTGRNYHLPTEAQWECAARAGVRTLWDWGNEFAPGRLNWRGYSLDPATTPVGSFPANAWGICDMLGNVWEWVLDAFDPEFYLYSPLKDPVFFKDECLTPGIRGGSFRDSLEFCRPGYRVNMWWWGDYDSIGFRVASQA